MKKRWIPCMAIVLLATMANCNSVKPAASVTGTAGDIYQGEWKLVSVHGTTVPEASLASLKFAAGRPALVSGHTGCNRFTGTCTFSDNGVVHFSPLASTRMACFDTAVASIENKLLDAFAQSANWQIVNHQLLLKNGENILALFNGQKPLTKEESKLNGTWELVDITGNTTALTVLFPRKKPILVFNFSGLQAGGNGGCNGYGCKVTTKGNQISFSNILSTMMACEGNGEPLYFQSLQTITSFKFTDDNSLTLLAGDQEALRFKRN